MSTQTKAFPDAGETVQTTDDVPFTARFEHVTPAKAQRWLDDKNRRNRPVRDDRVDRYAELMETGQWLASPDAIAFDHNGRLINGQHRLKAVVRSQTEQMMLVAFNLHPDAFKIADVGIKRTAADALAVEGFKMPQELAATVRLVILWQREELDRCNEYEIVENYDVVNMAETLQPRIYDSLQFISKHKQEVLGLMPRSLLAFAYFIYTPTYGRRAQTFITRFATDVGIQDWSERDWSDQDGTDDPVSPVKLLLDKMRDADMARERSLAFLIKAMNWYCKEVPRKRLRYRDSDRFPEPAVDQIPELAEEPTLPGM